MKTVYSVFGGSPVIAYDNPISGGFILPAKTVEDEPPQFNSETQVCNYVDGEWVVSEKNSELQEQETPFVPDDLMPWLRMKRDQILASSDWVMLPDFQGANRTAYETYRQQLRDVPQSISSGSSPAPTWDSELYEHEGNGIVFDWPTVP